MLDSSIDQCIHMLQIFFFLRCLFLLLLSNWAWNKWQNVTYSPRKLPSLSLLCSVQAVNQKGGFYVGKLNYSLLSPLIQTHSKRAEPDCFSAFTCYKYNLGWRTNFWTTGCGVILNSYTNWQSGSESKSSVPVSAVPQCLSGTSNNLSERHK